MTAFLFWIFAVGAVGSALLCITRKSPVASALWLVCTLFSLSALFLLLQAQFIAVIQVLVYAGAIMVLFLFVIMLLNLGREGRSDMVGWFGRIVTAGLGAMLLVQLWVLVRVLPPEALRVPAGAAFQALPADQGGVVAVISGPLFHEFLVPFELTSVLLLAAIVGAVVLAKRKL